MDRATVELLLPFVNEPYAQMSLEAYVAHRLSILYKTLENPLTTAESTKVTQGQIIELRRLLTLRDEINGEAKRL